MIGTVILIILIALFFGIFLVFLGKGFFARDTFQEPETYPLVSVLLAARDEEANIIDCLKALNGLDYPDDRIEILVGNDRSTDQTKNLVRDFIADKPCFRLIEVEWEWGKAKSKANALAWLAQEAKGDYFFITDADIRVPQKWIQGLLGGFTPERGLVSGISVVKGNGFFGRMQGLEWLYYMSILRILDDVKSVTAVGNNMAVRREAYWATGGYQNIDSSVTEDYKLFQEVTDLGWRHKHLFNPEVTGYSKPTGNLGHLLQQRKRWLRGGMELPASIWTLLAIHGFFVPAVLILLFLKPFLALIFILLKWLLQSVFLATLGRQLQVPVKAWTLIPFEPYHYFTNLAMPLYYCLPVKLKWKGRDI